MGGTSSRWAKAGDAMANHNRPGSRSLFVMVPAASPGGVLPQLLRVDDVAPKDYRLAAVGALGHPVRQRRIQVVGMPGEPVHERFGEGARLVDVALRDDLLHLV